MSDSTITPERREAWRELTEDRYCVTLRAADVRGLLNIADERDALVAAVERVRALHAPEPLSGVVHVNSLKTAREALCLAEGAIRHIHGPSPRVDVIAAMIRDIDEQRPLGPDGKHGDRHTPTCGCEPVPMTQEEKIAYRLAWDARVEEGKRKK